MRVRIPAVVGPTGKWCAYGYPGAQTNADWNMVEEVADNGDDPFYGYQRVWITVDLPDYADPVEVNGTAEVVKP
jgi:hypothetical protein